jgi:hypothetical protein
VDSPSNSNRSSSNDSNDSNNSNNSSSNDSSNVSMGANSVVYNTSASANPHPTRVNNQQLALHRFSSNRYRPPASQAAPWWETAQVQRASTKNRNLAPGQAGSSAVARLQPNNKSVARWPSSSVPPPLDAAGLRQGPNSKSARPSAWQMQLKAAPPPARRPFAWESEEGTVVARADPPSLVGKSEEEDTHPVPLVVATADHASVASGLVGSCGTIAEISSTASLSFDSFTTVPLRDLPSEQVDTVPLDQVEAEDFEYSDDACFSDGIFEGMTMDQPTQPTTTEPTTTEPTTTEPTTTTEPPSTTTPAMWTTHDVTMMMEAPNVETMSLNSIREPAKKKRVEQSAFGRAIAVPTTAYQAASAAIAGIARIMGDCIPADPPATSRIHSPSRKTPRPNKGDKNE